MPYRTRNPLPPKYERAREILLRFASQGPLSFPGPLNKESVHTELDELRGSAHGWIKPAPENLARIASLEEKLDSITRGDDIDSAIDNALCRIGFSHESLHYRAGTHSGTKIVDCYFKRLENNIGILTARDLATGEQMPSFYQIRSGELDNFKKWTQMTNRNEPFPDYGMALAKGVSVGTCFGSILGSLSSIIYMDSIGDTSYSFFPILLAAGGCALGFAAISAASERVDYQKKKAKAAAYPQRRKEYLKSVHLASGTDALLLATTPPYEAGRRPKLRVEAAYEETNTIDAEQEEPRRASLCPHKRSNNLATSK